jgi:CheY-like chemotaxis protein/sugar-specific transcriptional regulator TrmB
LHLRPNNTEDNSEYNSKNPSARLLVVDDEADLKNAIVEILTQEGYETTSAGSAKEALEKCREKQFVIILIDIRLPDMDGTSLLAKLKICAPETAKIMVTGFPSIETAVDSLNLGANGYIVKPFKPEQLLEIIKEQLRKRQEGKWENLLVCSGLSLYEAKIYLALTKENCPGVRSISMISGVPRTKSYTALKKLIQRGLAIELPGRTQRFSVATPSLAFKTILQSKKKELSEQATALVELENTISLLDSQVEKTNSSETLKKGEFWSIQGKEEIDSLISELLSKAENSVDISTNENGFNVFLKNNRKILENLVARKVNVQLKVPDVFTNQKLLDELNENYSVEFKSHVEALFLLYIDEKTFLLTNLYSVSPSLQKSFAIIFQNSGVEAFLANLFFSQRITAQM